MSLHYVSVEQSSAVVRHSVLESIKTSCFRGELFRNDIRGLGRGRDRSAGRSSGLCPARPLTSLRPRTLGDSACPRGPRAGKMDGWGNDGGQVESSLFNSSSRRERRADVGRLSPARATLDGARLKGPRNRGNHPRCGTLEKSGSPFRPPNPESGPTLFCVNGRRSSAGRHGGKTDGV